MPHLFVGLILAALGVWGVISWWNMFGLVMRGVVPFCLLVFGLIAILASCRRVAAGAFAGHASEFDMEMDAEPPGDDDVAEADGDMVEGGK